MLTATRKRPRNRNRLDINNIPNGLQATATCTMVTTKWQIDFSTPVATGQTWTIPNRSMSVRTQTGGFVAAATGTF